MRNKTKDTVLFLYGKLRPIEKAALYCDLHKCYLDKQQVFGKKFKCKRCKYMKNMGGETWDSI